GPDRAFGHFTELTAERTRAPDIRCSLIAKFAGEVCPRPIVRGEHEQRVVVDAELLQRIEDLADVVVPFHDLVAVLADAGLALELAGWKVRRMPHRERQIKEERFP